MSKRIRVHLSTFIMLTTVAATLLGLNLIERPGVYSVEVPTMAWDQGLRPTGIPPHIVQRNDYRIKLSYGWPRLWGERKSSRSDIVCFEEGLRDNIFICLGILVLLGAATEFIITRATPAPLTAPVSRSSLGLAKRT